VVRETVEVVEVVVSVLLSLTAKGSNDVAEFDKRRLRRLDAAPSSVAADSPDRSSSSERIGRRTEDLFTELRGDAALAVDTVVSPKKATPPRITAKCNVLLINAPLFFLLVV
jgi:hypothetical protein